MYGFGVGIFRFKTFAYLAKNPKLLFLRLYFPVYFYFNYLIGARLGDAAPPSVAWVCFSVASLFQAAMF